MAVRAAVLNLAGSLAHEANAEPFVEYVDSLNVDFAAFPEAFNKDGHDGLPETEERLRALGYTVTSQFYDDTDFTRTDRRGILVISRAGSLMPLWLGSRWAVMGTVKDPATNTVIAALGGHFDDRKEVTRQGQAHEAVRWMPNDMPKIMALDANAMYRSDPRSRLYRAAGPLVRHLPAHPPTIGQNEKKLSVIISKAQRIAEMADGGTLQILADAGLEDATNASRLKYAPTARFIGGLAAAQLDHILYEKKSLHVADPEILDVPYGKGVHTEHSMVRVEVGARSYLVRATIES